MSNTVEIRTNNVPRSLVYGYELPEKARAEFDYLTDDEFESRSFIKYKGQYFDFGDCMRIDENNLPADSHLNGWHGYYDGSAFHGTLIKLVDDDSVIVGQWFA